MSETTYTHRDLAALLGVSETTVKSYRRKFPGCIPVANQGKPIRFTDEASKVAIRIRDLFETGMSVEEVRARLCKEFVWISSDPGSEASSFPPSSRRVSRVAGKAHEVGPEISVGVSNMAKSMVAMTQQQKGLMAKLESIEAMLASVDSEGMGRVSAHEEKNRETVLAYEKKIEERFSLLDSAIQNLAEIMQKLSFELSAFMAGHAKDRKSNTASASGSSPDQQDEASALTPDWYEEEGTALDRGKSSHKSAQIIKMRPEPSVEVSGAVHEQDNEESRLQAPPKHFIGLPLVVRTQEGRYVGAGGRGRGRFSITDLKALLGYASQTHQYSMRWEAHGKGWWLFLEPETGETIKLLLMELPTQKSGNVVEILKLRSDATDMHPAEFAALLARLAE